MKESFFIILFLRSLNYIISYYIIKVNKKDFSKNLTVQKKYIYIYLKKLQSYYFLLYFIFYKLIIF
jgi:hypothetical protein